MNTKTLGLAAVLAASVGATEADADHRHRSRHHDRPGVSIVIGRPDGLCINPPYYIQDPYAPYGPFYPGYPQHVYPGYPQYAYPPYRSRIEIPLGRDVRIGIGNVPSHPPYYGPYYQYPPGYCY